MGSWARLYIGVNAEVGASGRLVLLDSPPDWPPHTELHAKYFVPALWSVGAGRLRAVEVEGSDEDDTAWAAFTFEQTSEWTRRIREAREAVRGQRDYTRAWWGIDLLMTLLAEHPPDSFVVLELSEILACTGDSWSQAMEELRGQLILGANAAGGRLPPLQAWPWLGDDLDAAAAEVRRASGTESDAEALLYAACGWPSHNPDLVSLWEHQCRNLGSPAPDR